MIARLFLALACTAALAGCAQQKSANDAAAADEGDAPGSAEAITQRPAGPDPDLPRELEMTARMLSKQLPLRQETPQGMVSVVAVEARGTEMIHTVEYPTDLTPGVFDQLKARLPERLCEDNQLRQLLLRGGSQTYVMRDKDGEEFRATVDRC